MKITPTKIKDVLIIEPQFFQDERGFFMETFQKDKYKEHGIPTEFFQDNLSESKKGVLRGLHYQAPPFEQGKLIQVIKGAVLDVAVDIRFGSPTFGQYVSAILSEENKKQLWIPPGFAHGFLTLSDTAIFSYRCTKPYSPEHDRGIAWNDPDLNIHWNIEDPIVSEKDKNHTKFRDIEKDFAYSSLKLNKKYLNDRKKILVTGGAGFIGSNFIHYILKKYPNYEITNLDVLNYAGNPENLRETENNINYKFIKGDITDKELVDDLAKDADVIVHFAAESHVDRSIMEPNAFIRSNIIGTYNLLNAARKNGNKRFHHISTDEVFGSLGPNDPAFNENTPYDPRSPYSASKAASDHLVRAYYHTYGLPITISNCSNNYGPYQFPEKLIPLFITNLLEGKKVPLYGDGMNIRDWLYVEDHCEAIDLIIHEGKIGETYNIGGGCEKNNKEITHKILELMGRGEEMIEYVKDRPGHDRRYAIDFSKIKNELGWTPRTDFEEGLKKTIKWYNENESWWRSIKSGEYKNYYKKNYPTAKG